MKTTKYTLTFAFLSALAILPSCSNDDINNGENPSVKGRIEFRATLPGVTRAAEVTTASIDDINVSSFLMGESSVKPYFIEKIFSKSETGKFISTDPRCIWPDNDAVLKFVAFHPSCEDMRNAGNFSDGDFTLTPLDEDAATAAFDYKISSFKIAGDISSQFDFVTAIASGNLMDDEEKGVDLNFDHQLSRIYLNAWGASTKYDVEIAGVRLGGVGTEGTFSFTSQSEAAESDEVNVNTNHWESVANGRVDYIFRAGDELVVLDKTESSPLSADKKVSILGKKVGEGENGYDNTAMLIPAEYTAWQYKENADNGVNNAEGLYFSVLLRVIGATPYNTGSLVYPYENNDEGMEVIYLAVDEQTGITVLTRLYPVDGKYYTDPDNTDTEYDLEANNAIVKTFGWAALPVSGNWKPGYEYTYTLDYTDGVGLRDPSDPKPGTPIISDKVLINVEVNEWKTGETTDVSVPRR